MAQSRSKSVEEVLVNTFSGLIGSWIITITTITYIHNPWLASMVTVVGCTLWSLLRGFAIRRHYAGKET